jgi:proliferating cell nuclear antigen
VCSSDLQKDNTNRNTVTKYSLDIHTITQLNLNIEKIEYDAIITLKSSEFNKICKDYSGLLGAKVLEIKNIGQSLILDSVGDICKSKTIYGNSNNTLFDIKVEDNIILGNYDLSYLVLFSKACKLSNNVEIFLKNDCPLILLYKVGTLGEMKFMLSPVE